MDQRLILKCRDYHAQLFGREQLQNHICGAWSLLQNQPPLSETAEQKQARWGAKEKRKKQEVEKAMKEEIRKIRDVVESAVDWEGMLAWRKEEEEKEKRKEIERKIKEFEVRMKKQEEEWRKKKNN
ncbi:vicilin-like seed storage protein At2g18540 [Belonocnema kinseyi]|uniref:vicilin-like seed storage protein At2g18540 n=1 Tax=Belonocnema kinseyi TaxID=2817044 RepID=UPI00143D96D8|nr:vicilin-like seed storage protein At2g18540 [Belonocnema kinseyi]